MRATLKRLAVTATVSTSLLAGTNVAQAVDIQSVTDTYLSNPVVELRADS
jgi:hypothetical protein